jgi:hypothetical protein
MGLLDRIPKQDEYKSYRRSLSVVALSGVESGFAVQARTGKQRVEKVDVFRTVLYIRARRRLGKVDPKAEVLERYNPWTPDTLPFVPDRKTALTISRRVSRKESRTIAAKRNGQRRKWRKELQGVGVRSLKKTTVVELPKKLEALPDVAFEALRLEFGLGGIKAKPHWRTTIRRFKLIGIRNMVREHPDMLKALTKLGFDQWQKWPPSTKRVSRGAVQSFVSFQEILGIKV